MLPPSSGRSRRYNPEDSHLRTHRRENLKSYLIGFVYEKKSVNALATILALFGDYISDSKATQRL
jgi:hypothetical protein